MEAFDINYVHCVRSLHHSVVVVLRFPRVIRHKKLSHYMSTAIHTAFPVRNNDDLLPRLTMFTLELVAIPLLTESLRLRAAIEREYSCSHVLRA